MDRKHRGEKSRISGAQTTASASHLVRAAERYLMLGKFDIAIEQLASAQRLEPSNQYIIAVLERAQMLQHQSTLKESGENPPSGKADSQTPRYLSVTVGKEFERGIKEVRADAPLSAQEIRLRVRQHVATAEALLSRGLSENAFDSLMKAYLLDPLAPEVLSCEKRVLPVWEMVRNQRGPGLLSQPGSVILQGDPERIEVLKKQKADERLEREREMWRDASSVSHPGGPSQPQGMPPVTGNGKNKQVGPGRRWKFL